jgi:hypothetical protein
MEYLKEPVVFGGAKCEECFSNANSLDIPLLFFKLIFNKW